MLELTWKIFCMTGNIDTYLLMKELESVEKENKKELSKCSEEEFDSTVH